MTQNITFKPFSQQYLQACMTIFEQNCPDYFAPNERQDYQKFLSDCPDGYDICLIDDNVVGAYGLCVDEHHKWHINWIMIASKAQGQGVGSAMMHRAIATAQQHSVETIHIAASHLSAPFFAQYGATVVKEIPNGWGTAMHRIDMVLVNLKSSFEIG